MVAPNAATIPNASVNIAACFAVTLPPGSYHSSDDNAPSAKAMPCRMYQPMTGQPITGGGNAP